MNLHAINVTLLPGGRGRQPIRFNGRAEDERAICILAEERIREEMGRGNGLGYQINCRDPDADKRIRAYLAGVSHEIQTWPGQRKRTLLTGGGA